MNRLRRRAIADTRKLEALRQKLEERTMASISISSDDQVFVLTGAGISAESGLPTFRAEDGLWAGYRVEDVCTPDAWERNPAGVWEFYSARRAAGMKAEPNPAHVALAELEAQAGRALLSLHAECGRPA